MRQIPNFSSLPTLLVFLLIVSTSPFLLLKILNVDNYILIAIISLILFIKIFIKKLDSGINFSVKYSIFVLVLMIQIGALFISYIVSEYNNDILFTILSLALSLLIILAIQSKEVNEDLLVRFILLAMSIISVLSILSVLLNILGYFNIYPIYDRGLKEEDGNIVYLAGLTLTNQYFSYQGNTLIRPSGVFDEPGQFGVMLILSLLLNQFSNKSAIFKVLLISGILFTLSIGAYVALFIYLFIYNRKISIALLVGLISIILIEFSVNRSDELDSILFNKTIYRLYQTFGFDQLGGNRAAGTIFGFDLISKVGLFSAGSVNTNSSEILEASSTFFSPFINLGIIGGAISYLHIFIFARISVRKFKFKFNLLYRAKWAIFFILLSTLFHRPTCNFIIYYIILELIYSKIKTEYEHRRSL